MISDQKADIFIQGVVAYLSDGLRYLLRGKGLTFTDYAEGRIELLRESGDDSPLDPDEAWTIFFFKALGSVSELALFTAALFWYSSSFAWRGDGGSVRISDFNVGGMHGHHQHATQNRTQRKQHQGTKKLHICDIK